MIYLVFLVVFLFCSHAAETAKEPLNVHIVCHTHSDVGWLKTIDQYYYGANNTIQHAGVQYILDSVMVALEQNPDRKFHFVEQAFFQRWYRQQNDAVKQKVKKFIADGQLDFINGGWCMHDEATTHWIELIDQTTLGHRFLVNEFGVRPTIGWQIDPFGHSSTQASLLSAEAGFDALFFGRIDYQDREKRLEESDLEFIWRSSPSLGKNAEIFTGSFQNGNYGPPEGFCFDQSCVDTPIQDDPLLEDYNVESRVEDFVQASLEMKSHAHGNDIMFTMGSDFQYENANLWFKNLDKLIHHVNKDGRVKAFYSSPMDYAKAKVRSNVTWSLKTDDFFPYADCPHCYWTGYYTSRPSLKVLVRHSAGYLLAARQFEVFNKLDGSDTSLLEKAVAVNQHHDAVTGTSKQHVAEDYAKRLSIGLDHAEAMVNKLYSPAGNAAVSQCRLLNVSLCDITSSTTAHNRNNSGFRVQIYNPLAYERTEFLTIPISSSHVTVYANNGKPVAAQVVKKLLSAAASAPEWSLSFNYTIAGLNHETFVVKTTSDSDPNRAQVAPATLPTSWAVMDREAMLNTVENMQKGYQTITTGNDFSISNDVYELTFKKGLLAAIKNKVRNFTTNIKQSLYWYNASAWNGDWDNSGAYLFRPNSSHVFSITDKEPEVEIVRGKLFSEVRQRFSSWVSQTIRLRAGEDFAEFEHTVGPIPIDDGCGKEVVTRFESDIQSKELLYTDSNGREFIERRRNFRPTFKLNLTEPVASNYYPINSACYIKDDKHHLSLLTERARGAASLADGAIEVMLHRRLLIDDKLGVNEPLNETDSMTHYPNPVRLGKGLITTGTTYLQLESKKLGVRKARLMSSRIYTRPVYVFSDLDHDTKLTPAKALSPLPRYVSASTKAEAYSLPKNLELVTLQVWEGQPNAVLLRLAHSFAVGEDEEYSAPAQASIAKLLRGFKISKVIELSLTANNEREKMAPLFPHKIKDDAIPPANTPRPRTLAPAVGDDFVVTLQPMEVRTYKVVYQ